MNSKELVQAKLLNKKTDRLVFCPAIYEHKAKLIGKSISEVANEPSLIYQAVLAEYETYKPDMLTIGFDIYNIEAEAIGCNVKFFSEPNMVPSIDKKVLNDISCIEELPYVDAEKAGRMPEILKVTQQINEQLVNEIYVRGAISGPFSIAAELLGIEKLLIGMITEIDSFKSLMDYCCKVSLNYGLAFAKRELPVCVFDSQVSPPLVSPDIYRSLILPYVQKMMLEFKNNGCVFTEYVVGSQTNSIADAMAQTGADIILSDFSSDFEEFVNCTNIIRRNINPILIENGPENELKKQIDYTVNLAQKRSNVIIGTGVISYDTPVENVLKTKKNVIGD